jgi:glycosyltransferase involved in cell wall biosynthesis
VLEIHDAGSEDLQALYTLAHVLLFPSLCEGFGWPIIEAQACGCPVVTSDRPPLTEVAGDAALFVPPEEIDAAAAAIASSWSRLALQKERGLLNAARYTTSSMIDAYLREYATLRASFRRA